IDSISNGRFGLNVITGWQRPEYSQMGLWPGDEYFGHRYRYAAEYVQILRDLWERGVSDLKGDFFTMNDCKLSPRPQADMKIICAGQSDAGLEFTAKYADYNFCFAKGINTPLACTDTVARMQSYAAGTGRKVASYALTMVITGETDAEAEAKWELYRDGADLEALAWLVEQATADKNPTGDSNVRHAIDPKSMVNINIGLLLGSHAKVARMLDEMATIPGLAGVLLTFDEFISGTEIFGERIQPLMACRRHVTPLAKAAE
ncbi:MAG: pyrimidine oxygenase, partial [Rhodospirillaceae bacterium]|nr:pyrimidine oxygenase [Rhodospirillaceae bacterium]